MPNTRRGKERFFLYDQELEHTLRNMNRNLGINDENPHKYIPAPVDVHGQMLPDAPGDNQQRGQNPAPWPNAREGSVDGDNGNGYCRPGACRTGN